MAEFIHLYLMCSCFIIDYYLFINFNDEICWESKYIFKKVIFSVVLHNKYMKLIKLLRSYYNELQNVIKN